MTRPTGAEAREAARKCESAGLIAEADLLYRLAVSQELGERGSFAASFARVLIASGKLEEVRPIVLDSNDPVLMATLALEAHDFREARRLLDDARERDPFDPRSASARGRLLFMEKRFHEAVLDLLEAALLRPDGLPDSQDARFLRAARALARAELPSWPEAVSTANQRLQQEARRRAPNLSWTDRGPALVRALIARGGETRGLLERAQRLVDVAAPTGVGDRALLAAAAGGELRRLAPGATLYRAGDLAAEIYFVVAGSIQLVRETPVGPQPVGMAGPSDFSGEEALVGQPRTGDARALEPLTLLGLTRDFLFENADRAPWLRHLRRCLARRLGHLNDLFREFFPGERPSRETQRPAAGRAAAISAEEKSRFLGGGGLRESDRILFAAFAEEREYPAESLIFREGDRGDALYAIARGRVRISRQIAGGEEALAILAPGEIFGEMAILDPDSAGRSADARAHEETVLLELSRSRFEGLEESDPEGCADLSALLCRLAARRCVETAERLARWRILAGPSWKNL